MMTNEERKATRHAAYLRRKVAGYYAIKPESVTGTMGAIESPDSVESIAPNLREKYLAALLARDAKVWRKHQSAAECAMGHDDGLSPGEASKTKHVLSEAEKHAANDGRPKSLTRQAAIATGAMKYIRERPCAKCGGNIFYTNNCACVGCRNAPRADAVRTNIPRVSQYTRPLNASRAVPKISQRVPALRFR